MSMSVFHSIFFFFLKNPFLPGCGEGTSAAFSVLQQQPPYERQIPESHPLSPCPESANTPRKEMNADCWLKSLTFPLFRNILYLPSPGRFHICPMPWNSLLCFAHLAFLIVSKKRMVCYKLLHHKQTQKSIVWVLGSPCYGNQEELPEDICSENTHWWPYPRVSITGYNHNSSKLQQNIDQPFTFLHLIYKDIICSS